VRAELVIARGKICMRAHVCTLMRGALALSTLSVTL
jgi:hypothetical protein